MNQQLKMAVTFLLCAMALLGGVLLVAALFQRAGIFLLPLIFLIPLWVGLRFRSNRPQFRLPSTEPEQDPADWWKEKPTDPNWWKKHA